MGRNLDLQRLGGGYYGVIGMGREGSEAGILGGGGSLGPEIGWEVRGGTGCKGSGGGRGPKESGQREVGGRGGAGLQGGGSGRALKGPRRGPEGQ